MCTPPVHRAVYVFRAGFEFNRKSEIGGERCWIRLVKTTHEVSDVQGARPSLGMRRPCSITAPRLSRGGEGRLGKRHVDGFRLERAEPLGKLIRISFQIWAPRPPRVGVRHGLAQPDQKLRGSF